MSSPQGRPAKLQKLEPEKPPPNLTIIYANKKFFTQQLFVSHWSIYFGKSIEKWIEQGKDPNMAEVNIDGSVVPDLPPQMLVADVQQPRQENDVQDNDEEDDGDDVQVVPAPDNAHAVDDQYLFDVLSGRDDETKQQQLEFILDLMEPGSVRSIEGPEERRVAATWFKFLDSSKGMTMVGNSFVDEVLKEDSKDYGFDKVMDVFVKVHELNIPGKVRKIVDAQLVEFFESSPRLFTEEHVAFICKVAKMDGSQPAIYSEFINILPEDIRSDATKVANLQNDNTLAPFVALTIQKEYQEVVIDELGFVVRCSTNKMKVSKMIGAENAFRELYNEEWSAYQKKK